MATESPSLASLTDLPSLERRLSAEGVDALLASLDEALAQTPPESRLRKDDGPTVGLRTLRILRSAIALDADFLREHPEALFQCLYNRLRWFDAPDVAPHFPPESQGPWTHPEAHLFALAEHWRRQREASGGAPWLESLTPLRGELETTDQVLPHDVHVLCAAYSPSGALLATGTWEDGQNVCIWDVATGTRTQVMEGHEGEVRSVAWSQDGTRLASGSRDHDARVWDARTGELLHAFTRQEGRVTSVAFSPSGRWLATANLGWIVRLFDVESGREARTLKGHEQSVLSVAFHPSGRWLASGSSDETVRIWDLETGAQVALIPAGSSVTTVAFSPDGEWLALNAAEGIARVETRGWTLAPGVCGTGRYSQLAWLGNTRLGALRYDQVEVLDARSGEVLRTRPYPSDGHERGAAFHPAGKRFALTARNGRVRLSDFDAEPTPALLADEDGVQHLWGQAEGPMGIARRRRSSAVIDAGGHVRDFPPDYTEAFGQPWAVSPDGSLLAYPIQRLREQSWHSGVQLLDARSLAPVRALSVEPAGEDAGADLYGAPRPIAFSPDGRLLAASVEDGAVRLWRVSDGALLHTLRGSGGPVSVVAFTPDGAHVVSGHSDDSRLLVHEVASGTLRIDTEALMDPQPSYAVAARAPRIAVGRDSGALELLDVPAGSRRVIQAAEEPVMGVGLSADGSRVAACCMDRRVRLYDTRTGALLHELPHPSLAFAVALDEDVVITQSNDQRTRFFDLETGAPRAELPGAAVPDDALLRPLWETLGEGPVSFHRRKDATPLVHFHDPLEEVLILRDGLVLARGRTEKDFLYVLKLR